MNPNFPQNQSSATIDEQFNQAKSLYESGRFIETVTVLANILPSLQSSGERMLTAKTIITILFHDVLKGYPKPNTPEYDSFRYYLNTSLSNFDLAEEDYRLKYLYIQVGEYENELALHKSIIEQMNQNLVIQEEFSIVKSSPVWHEREVFKAGQKIDYEMDIFHKVEAINNSFDGKPITIAKGDEQTYTLLKQDNAKKVATFAPDDVGVIDEVKRWAERTDVALVTIWKPSDGYELWVMEETSSNNSYYIYKDNQQFGPYEESIIKQWLDSRQLSPNDYAMRQGMTEWKPLGTLISTPQVSGNLEMEVRLLDVYSDELDDLQSHIFEADERTSKELQKHFQQKLQIFTNQIFSIKNQFPQFAEELKIYEADIYMRQAFLKAFATGFMRSVASGTGSLLVGITAGLFARQQEKNGLLEAIQLIDYSLSIYDSPSARILKATICRDMGNKAQALADLNYIVVNFPNDEAYIRARQLIDEIQFGR